jgi:hypothetical protein
MTTTVASHTIQKATVAAGSAISTGTVMGTVVIFTDSSYMYFALAGGIVSTLGVIHDIYGFHSGEYTNARIITEVLKGIVLGLLAIPFWFLVITEGMLGQITSIELGHVSGSLALLISFALSWFTVPIFNYISDKLSRIGMFGVSK